MALTREEVNNAIVRAKCGLSDIYAELVKARAQGSKKAEELRRKAAKLFAFISALENVLDCDPPPTSTANPSGPICDVDALFVAKCYTPDPDVFGTGLLNLVVLAGSSTVPYQDYYYTYETASDPDGPWTELTSEHGNMVLGQLLGSTDAFLRVTAACTEGGTSKVIVSETKNADGALDYNTFGYFTSTSLGTTAPLSEDIYIRDPDTITISNLNTELIISAIYNVRTEVLLGSNSNSISISTGGNIIDGDQLYIQFDYLPGDLPCNFARIVTVHLVPTPVISKSPSVICPSSDVSLHIDNYSYDTYLWSTGETSPTITVSSEGIYACLVSCGTVTGLIDYETVTLAGPLPDPYIAFASDGTPVPDGFTVCSNDAAVFFTIKDNVYTSGYPSGSTVTISGAQPALNANTLNEALQGSPSVLTLNLSIAGIPCVFDTPTITVNSVSIPSRFVATDVSCGGYADGILNIEVFDSDPLYTTCIFTLYDLDNVTVIGTYNALAPTMDITDLPAGTYSYDIDITYNGVDCYFQGSTVTINEPAPITGSITSYSNCTCNNSMDAYVIVSATGGVGTLTYSLNGNTSLTGSFFGLKPDTYTVLVYDSNGCTLNLGSLTLTEPDPLVLAVEVTACYEPLNPGVITYSGFTGGSGTLTTLSLYDSSFTLIEDLSMSLPIAVYDFVNLPPNDYILIGADTNGCSYQSTFLTILTC